MLVNATVLLLLKFLRLLASNLYVYQQISLVIVENSDNFWGFWWGVFHVETTGIVGQAVVRLSALVSSVFSPHVDKEV